MGKRRRQPAKREPKKKAKPTHTIKAREMVKFDGKRAIVLRQAKKPGEIVLVVREVHPHSVPAGKKQQIKRYQREIAELQKEWGITTAFKILEGESGFGSAAAKRAQETLRTVPESIWDRIRSLNHTIRYMGKKRKPIVLTKTLKVKEGQVQRARQRKKATGKKPTARERQAMREKSWIANARKMSFVQGKKYLAAKGFSSARIEKVLSRKRRR